MKDYPIVGILKSGEHITDLKHPLFNHYSASILDCKAHLEKALLGNETPTIYVVEDSARVFSEMPDGRTFEFFS